MRTHYDPYPNCEESEGQAACGTWLGEGSDLSDDWHRVDCQRCLNNRGRISAAIDAYEDEIVRQMGDMANFMRGQSLEESNEVKQ